MMCPRCEMEFEKTAPDYEEAKKMIREKGVCPYCEHLPEEK